MLFSMFTHGQSNIESNVNKQGCLTANAWAKSCFSLCLCQNVCRTSCKHNKSSGPEFVCCRKQGPLHPAGIAGTERREKDRKWKPSLQGINSVVKQQSMYVPNTSKHILIANKQSNRISKCISCAINDNGFTMPLKVHAKAVQLTKTTVFSLLTSLMSFWFAIITSLVGNTFNRSAFTMPNCAVLPRANLDHFWVVKQPMTRRPCKPCSPEEFILTS